MKTSKKILSLILAVVMIFSTMSVMAFAAIPSGVKTIDALVENKNLASLVDWLLSNLNGAKKNVTGTVLRLVFNFIDNDDLNAVIGGEDVTKLSDEKAAKILLDWLDGMLPELTKDIDFTDISGINVKSLVKLLGVDNLDITSVDNILGVVYDICDFADGTILPVGDVKKLNGSALKNVKRSGGDLNVIYALLQWLDDNSELICSFVKGGIGSDGLSIGTLFNDILGGSLESINKIVKNIPDFAKSFIYLLIDGHAKGGDIKEDPKGDWGKSQYASYTADEMLAAAVIRLIEGKEPEEKIEKSECDAALNLSFYKLLAKYGKEVYARFAVEPLNNGLKDLLKNLEAFEDTKNIFNYDYTFTADSFNEAFANIDTVGVIGQLNNILVTILKTITKADVFAALDLAAGDNSNLNANLAKVCRYVLPILANHSADLGFDFSKFTADAVKDMELAEMATAVLKVFFPGWFSDNYDADLVNACETVGQLGVAALYFVVTNNEWITLDNGFTANEFLTDVTPAKIASLNDEECKEILGNIGIKLGAYTLDAKKDDISFVLDKSASDFDAYANNIVDWAINFVKGLPAVMVDANVYNAPYGAFYKLNVALNELINFNFLSNVNDATFALDLETLIYDAILDNAFNFDLEAVFAIFAKNTNPGNFLNEGTVISSTIGVVDRLLTALFKHNHGTEKVFAKELDCTTDLTGKYDTNNGHYVGATSTKAADHHKYALTDSVAATCKDDGLDTFTCEKCGNVKKDVTEKTGVHTYVESDKSTATCTKAGFLVLVCKDCGTETKKASPALGHNYVEGVCTRCGEKETPDTPVDPPVEDYLPGDADMNGSLEAADARLTLRASLKLDKIEEGSTAFKAADVDGNGILEASDARSILRASLKLETLTKR